MILTIILQKGANFTPKASAHKINFVFCLRSSSSPWKRHRNQWRSTHATKRKFRKFGFGMERMKEVRDLMFLSSWYCWHISSRSFEHVSVSVCFFLIRRKRVSQGFSVTAETAPDAVRYRGHLLERNCSNPCGWSVRFANKLIRPVRIRPVYRLVRIWEELGKHMCQIWQKLRRPRPKPSWLNLDVTDTSDSDVVVDFY